MYYMSTETRQSVEEIIAELLRDAAMNLALKADSEARYPWRRHDARIYAERAEAALRAVKHLEGEL